MTENGTSKCGIELNVPETMKVFGEGNGNPLQYSCLENSMDRGAWWATIHGVQRVRHDWVTNTLEVKTAQEEFSGDFHKTFSRSPSTLFQGLFCSQLHQSMVRKIQHNICHLGGWNDGSVISVRVQRLSYNSFWHTNLKEIIYFASLGDNSKEKIKYTFEKKFK